MCQAQEPSVRGQIKPRPVQQNTYNDYDYDSGNRRAIVDNDTPDEYEAFDGPGIRTEGRPANPNSLIRQGPPLQGVLAFGDERADCKTKYRTLPHEKYCDIYYEQTGCSSTKPDASQAILRSCPNGLVYTGNGRSGLIGVCDYPHRADCEDKERHSKWIHSQNCIL